MRKQYNPIIIPQINQSTEAVSSANCGTYCKLFKGIEKSLRLRTKRQKQLGLSRANRTSEESCKAREENVKINQLASTKVSSLASFHTHVEPQNPTNCNYSLFGMRSSIKHVINRSHNHEAMIAITVISVLIM